MAIFLYIVGGVLIFIGVLFNFGLALAGVSTLVLGAIVGRVDRAAFARMIEQGADPKVRNDNGRPLLHRAAKNGRLDAGADSNTHDRNGLILVHSPSAVKLYKDCPHKYMRLKVKKDMEDETGPAGERGKRIHDALRSYIEGRVPAVEADVEEVEMLWRGSEIVDGMKRERNVQAELRVGLDRNLEGTDFFSSRVWMRGVIDMLALGKSEAEIIDWKTGKRRFDRFQADFYAMAVFALFPDVQRITVVYVWLKLWLKAATRDRALDQLVYTRDEMPKLGKRLIRAAKPIEQDETWEKQPGPLCRWCPVRDCEHSEATAVGEAKGEDRGFVVTPPGFGPSGERLPPRKR